MAAASGSGSGPGRCSKSATGRTAPWRRTRSSPPRMAGGGSNEIRSPSYRNEKFATYDVAFFDGLFTIYKPGLISLSWPGLFQRLLSFFLSSPINSCFGQRLDYRRRRRWQRRPRALPPSLYRRVSCFCTRPPSPARSRLRLSPSCMA